MLKICMFCIMFFLTQVFIAAIVENGDNDNEDHDVFAPMADMEGHIANMHAGQ